MDLDDDELKATLEMNCYKGDKIKKMILPRKKQPAVSNVELGTAYDINKNLVKKYEHHLTEKELKEKFTLLEEYTLEKFKRLYSISYNSVRR